MPGSGANVDGGRELDMVRQEQPLLGRLIEKLIFAINKSATNSATASIGELPAPPGVNETSVKGTYNSATNTLTTPGEILHWVHTHNSPLQRGIQYVTEVANDPNFINAHPIDTGASRSGFHSLPALDDDGLPVNYYLRVVAQNHGSAPSTPTVFGGANNPTKIVLTGATQMTLLNTQGAGTAKPGQTGKGLGDVLFRGSVGGPKRLLP